MKAYAIFDGGGVLGAALAGCLAAAEEQGIAFDGFGGTSAGSVVALLAAAGYNGKELEAVLVGTEFTSLLNGAGAPVEAFKAEVGRLAGDLQAGTLWNAFDALRRLRRLSATVRPRFGVDDGADLRRFLLRKIGEKKPALRGYADVTFDDLDRAGCLPLKVVASDVTRRRPVVFSKGCAGYGGSALDAVRASTSYPFVFEPFVLNGRRLVDGGLASNLPAFLFHEEYGRTGHPVFAFDLTAEEADPPEPYPLSDYLKDMVSTAIDAGDELMRDALRDVIHVPVPVPARFDVLNFRITRDERGQLFNIGYRATARRLSGLDFLETVKKAGDDLRKRLQARYGHPMIYEPVLAGLAREVEAETKARRVRAHLMLPTGRGTRIVVYSYGMRVERDDGRVEFHPDHDLEIPEDAGCSGRAWATKAPVVADLAEAAHDPARWRMTPEQHHKVPRDRKAMLSVPVRCYSDGEGAGDADLPVVGTLSVDSSTPLADTSWMEGDAVRPEVMTRVLLWENVVRRLLRKRHP
jgi:NTE family protein